MGMLYSSGLMYKRQVKVAQFCPKNEDDDEYEHEYDDKSHAQDSTRPRSRPRSRYPKIEFVSLK
jgi:hypothetical protein